MYEVTHILNGIGQGDVRAAEKLLPLVYDELRKLAAHWLAQENAGRDWSQRSKSQNWLVLAMARFCLREIDEAQHCLSTARQLMTDGRPTLGNQSNELAAADRIELTVLLREAETLIQNTEVSGLAVLPTSDEQTFQPIRRARPEIVGRC